MLGFSEQKTRVWGYRNAEIPASDFSLNICLDKNIGKHILKFFVIRIILISTRNNSDSSSTNEFCSVNLKVFLWSDKPLRLQGWSIGNSNCQYLKYWLSIPLQNLFLCRKIVNLRNSFDFNSFDFTDGYVGKSRILPQVDFSSSVSLCETFVTRWQSNGSSGLSKSWIKMTCD